MMKSAFPRFVLAIAFLGLTPVCTAQSYVVLLKNPVDVENHVHVINSKGIFGIHNPGYGSVLNKDIETVQRYEPEQINADFADALAGMKAILDAGLPPLSHSYVALMEMPSKKLGYIAYNPGGQNILLEEADQAVMIDGYSDEPYMADRQQLTKDFGPALVSLNEIIEAGFRPNTFVVLLESPDGSVGKVSVTDERGKVLIDEAGEAVDMGVYLTDERLFKLEDKEVKQEFGNALESRPVLPVKYIVMFQSGSTKIANESKDDASRMLEDIQSRAAPDITITGHTDTVGKDKFNDKLSRERAEFIAETIRNLGKELTAMDIDYYGEHKLYVKTADNKAELKNRRVEIIVR